MVNYIEIYIHTKPNWFEATENECKAARESAIILDQTSFGKHLIKGEDSLTFYSVLVQVTLMYPLVNYIHIC